MGAVSLRFDVTKSIQLLFLAGSLSMVHFGGGEAPGEELDAVR